jgi:transposase-like protein
VTRTDSGGQQFNYSEVFGSALSAGISTYSYHPRSDRNIGNTLSVWGTQVGYDTITIVVKEFWPDIRRKLKKKKG